MYLRTQRLLQRKADLFTAGRLGEMAEDCAFPHPVQMEDNLIVLRDVAAWTDALAARRDAFLARGITSFAVRIGAVELPREGRFRAWAHWTHHWADGAEAAGSDVIYYLRVRPDGRPVVEMTDYIRLSMIDTKFYDPEERRSA